VFGSVHKHTQTIALVVGLVAKRKARQGKTRTKHTQTNKQPMMHTSTRNSGAGSSSSSRSKKLHISNMVVPMTIPSPLSLLSLPRAMQDLYNEKVQRRKEKKRLQKFEKDLVRMGVMRQRRSSSRRDSSGMMMTTTQKKNHKNKTTKGNSNSNNIIIKQTSKKHKHLHDGFLNLEDQELLF
jgi:hypothetical protein